MPLQSHLLLMAQYNVWMNNNIYQVVETLTSAEFVEDRGAFFGSVCGALNHIAVADTIWLKRFAQHPAQYALLEPIRRLSAPAALGQILFQDFSSLRDYRVFLDQIISVWVEGLAEDQLSSTLSYVNMKGIAAQKLLGHVLMHFFNHQTHHRGQLTTLLTQLGKEVGVTDLLMLIPNEQAGE